MQKLLVTYNKQFLSFPYLLCCFLCFYTCQTHASNLEHTAYKCRVAIQSFTELETQYQESIYAKSLIVKVAYMEQQRGISKHGSNGNAKGKERMTRRLIVEDERGDINELADAFIKNFRNQLKIQREESLKRRQEMICRQSLKFEG